MNHRDNPEGRMLKGTQQTPFSSKGSPQKDDQNEKQGAATIKHCEHCQRPVKEANLHRHLEACSKAPKDCAYCDEQVQSQNFQNHKNERVQKHGNVIKKASETTAHVRSTLNEASHQVTQDFRHCPEITDKDNLWFGYMSSGDWLSAAVAIEEGSKLDSSEQAEVYAAFSSRLVELNVKDVVGDVLEAPCPVQPYDCLLAVLIVRAYLPRNVWVRKEDVTWKHALRYLPAFLTHRLSETALKYLSRFPVFPHQGSSRAVDEVGVDATGTQLIENLAVSVLPEGEQVGTVFRI